MAVGGGTHGARCRRLSAQASLVVLTDGSSFVLSDSRIRRWRRAASGLADQPQGSALLHAAEADLSGSYDLYATELTSQLERGKRVITRRVTTGGHDAYEVQLAPDLPRAEILVDERTLRPRAARLESARLSGVATLPPPLPKGAASSC